MPDTNEIEQVRRQMARIRCELDENVEDVVVSARAMTDWRYYVRAYPWASVAVALAAGYFVVPRRVEIVRPDAAEIAKLAKKNRIVVQDKSKAHEKADRGISGAILTFASNMLMRSLMAYVGQQIGKMATPAQEEGAATYAANGPTNYRGDTHG